MKIKKAVITAAAENQRALPLQTLIDRDGEEKSVLGIVVEQALKANVDQICVITWPGDENKYAESIRQHVGRVRFLAQSEPRGYGDAIYCARDFTGADPFLHLVGDHLYVSFGDVTCAQRLVQLAEAEACAVSAVQPTRENLLAMYGTVGARRLSGRQGVYRIETVVEKPTPTEAEQRLIVPGMRAGYYLCFFGMHVLTPAIMDILGRARSQSGRLQLSPALDELARREQYLAIEDPDRRYDIGVRYGLLTAQLALALGGQDRGEVLSRLMDLFVDRELAIGAAGKQ